MRTTLTLDDDLARELRDEARTSGRPFKVVVNEALRRGLSTGAKPGRRPPPFRVRAKASGFQPGIDLRRLNQLVDDIEISRVSVPPRRRSRG